jgi:hypothetical protein
MKVRAACALLPFLALLSGIGLAEGPQYQAGKVVKVEKQKSQSRTAGTDSPLTAEVASYRVSIQIGDKVYVCNYKSDPESYSWAVGKDVEARISGKAMYVKKSAGRELKGSILSTAPASSQ